MLRARLPYGGTNGIRHTPRPNSGGLAAHALLFFCHQDLLPNPGASIPMTARPGPAAGTTASDLTAAATPPAAPAGVCTHLHTCTHMHTYMHACTHTHMHTHARSHAHTYARTHVHTHADTHRDMHAHTQPLQLISAAVGAQGSPHAVIPAEGQGLGSPPAHAIATAPLQSPPPAISQCSAEGVQGKREAGPAS